MGSARSGGDVEGTEFRVLGPLEVRVDGRPLNLGGPRLRALIALLTANIGRVVAVTALVEALWGANEPTGAHRTARTYVSRLRRLLSPVTTANDLIVTHPHGYVLRLSPELVDTTRFEHLAAAGRGDLAAGRPAAAVEQLSAALTLWRGDPYGEFADIPALRSEALRLRQLWLTATQDRIDAQLAVGVGDTLVGELIELTERHPGHDRLWGQLMISLYRAGRLAEALEAFLRARTALVDRAGLDPSPALVKIHRQMLDHDPALLAAAHPGGSRTAGVRPAQLPPDVAAFTGRQRELAELDAAVASGGSGRSAVIVGVSGTAGIGKTTLAVRWAHRMRAAFPDGQLYVNLHGYDLSGSIVRPAEALRGFLDAFGVPPASIPTGLEGQAGLYRSLLTERRVLVVLDNARNAEQVRPLLPGAPGCAALVTSRDQLTSLAAAEGARLLTVDLFDSAEARDLLVGRLGGPRVTAEPDSVAEIIARCGGLPLALAIVAARAAAQPPLPLGRFAEELREFARRLDFLDGGDPATQVRAVFSWSYDALSEAAARLFRLLGLHPGPDITLPAVASLAGVPPVDIRPLLTELIRHHLVAEPVAGRYSCHDLLHDYAAELAASQDSPDVRRAATHRMLDHYLHAAVAADAVLTPQPRPMALLAAQPGAVPEKPQSHEDARAWFNAEHRVLLAVVEHAVAAGFDTHAWQLASALTTYLDRHGYWRALAAAHATALRAAQQGDNVAGPASAHRCLGLAQDRLGRRDSAHGHYRLALELFAVLGDHAGQARTRQHLARMSSAKRDYEQASDHARHSLTHYRAVNDRAGQSAALNQLGWCAAQLGRFDLALPRCRLALLLANGIGDLNGQAHIWDSLGYIRHHLGQHEEAVACYGQAVDLFRRTGERRSEAACLVGLAGAHHAAGDTEAARASWRHALTIIDELGLPDLDPVRATIVRSLGSDPVTATTSSEPRRRSR